MAEIAREADVAEKTVFNYFPTKEDLFYSRLEAFEEELLAAIRERAPGESVAGRVRATSCSSRAACSRCRAPTATRRPPSSCARSRA